MVKRLIRNGETFYDGELVTFRYEDRDCKGLLFFQEAERKFMILLAEDNIIPVGEIQENTLKLL